MPTQCLTELRKEDSGPKEDEDSTTTSAPNSDTATEATIQSDETVPAIVETSPLVPLNTHIDRAGTAYNEQFSGVVGEENKERKLPHMSNLV